jgi:PAS domain S-box-containing protein
LRDAVENQINDLINRSNYSLIVSTGKREIFWIFARIGRKHVDITTQTVLLIDDCLEDRKIYHRYLLRDKRHSYSILEAQTGEEGLVLCRQQFPDVILLDYMLPDMDGLEFLDELKKGFACVNFPVIMLTGQGSEQIAVQAMKSGAAEYLGKKNLTPESLRLAIQYAIEQQAAQSSRKQAEVERQQANDELEIKVQQRTEELIQANQELQTTFEALKAVEEKLRQRNEELAVSCDAIELEKQRYQKLFEFAPDGYLVTDIRGKIQEANQQASILLSVEQKRLIGKPLLVFIAKSERKSFLTRLTELQRVQSWEIYLQPRSGSPFPATVSVTSIHDSKGQRVGLRWLLRDISDRKQVENELRRMSAALSHAVEGISQIDCQGRYIMVNQAYANAVGYTPEKMVGMEWQQTVHPEDLEMMAAAYQQMLSAGKVEVEARGIRKDGSIFYKQLVMIADYDERKRLTGHYCFMKDISDRKQAQEKMREQAALLNIASDAIFVRDLEHRILFWNSGAERLYGWTAEEMIGKKANELLCLKISLQIEEILTTVLEFGSWQGELQKLTKSGKEAIVSSRMTLVRDETGQPKSILTVDTDITEKKQLEAQFYQAQRLESLGTLASGIAHDINNILTPILAFSQLLPLKLPNLDEQNRRLLEILTDNAKRGAQLVKQILLFSRVEPEKRVILRLENLLEETDRIIKETFPKSIEISSERANDKVLWTVSADSIQIYQVLMNLCVNARDAMPNGGILTISVKNQFFDENYVRMNLEAKIGHYVVITISDTGCGMSPQVKERIFEPFFTTKESGKGTGLGLSTAIGIVKNHGGFLTVKSEVGQGSQFQVCLPAINTEATQKNTEFQIVRGNGELILVVDDEASIREITQTSLLNYNYKVLTACDGFEALSLYEQHKEAIALVLMDMQMPLISGLKTIRVLRQMNPQLKIIAISGLTSNRKLLEDLSIDVQAFLSKPYTIEELLDTIHWAIRKP